MSDEKEIVYDILKTKHGEYKTTFNEMYRRRKKWQPANPKHLLSIIPGTVVSFSVKPGDEIEIGDDLMMFQAMKMNNRVKSAIKGVVKTLEVKVGDRIPKGTLMITFE